MIHPLAVLQSLDPVQSEDPIKRAGVLEQLRNTMGQGLIQQQQIAQNNDAAKTRQSAIQADADVARIIQGAKIDDDGNLDPETEAALVKNGSPHAQAILTNISTVAGRKSNAQRDRDLTQQGKATLAETVENNKATALRDYMKIQDARTREVSPGASLIGPDGKVIATAPKAETPNNLQHVPVIDPRDKSQSPIMANYDDRKGVYTDQSGNVIPNARPVPTLATMGDSAGLTDAAKQMLAQQLLATGQIPNVGSGAAGVKQRTDIANRAAAGTAETPNLAANGANFKADSGSLSALQKNRDAVVAFENTAGKNLDLFLNQVKGVIDSGSPWINQPLRVVAQRGLGSADLAAFNTARQVAINEIAKVTSSPGLTGVLSDSARHEIEAFIPAEATLKQIYNVASVLKQDMKNRHVSYDDQISEIKGRMSTKPATGPGAVIRYDSQGNRIQ